MERKIFKKQQIEILTCKFHTDSLWLLCSQNPQKDSSLSIAFFLTGQECFIWSASRNVSSTTAALWFFCLTETQPKSRKMSKSFLNFIKCLFPFSFLQRARNSFVWTAFSLLDFHYIYLWAECFGSAWITTLSL